MARPRRKRWPEGTWMRLISPELLLALMKAAGLSYAQLADYTKCSKGFISHLTSGRRSSCKTDTAERIAEVLKVPVTTLFEVRQSTSDTPAVKTKASAA